MLSFLRAEAQYISEVIEYKPAPGQFINSAPWGVPASAGSLAGGINGTLCLGSFGGYVIFRFDRPVDNHPDNPFGVDFTIFGNPLPDWSEPGVVSVMKDENGNGLPDDTWYELAGSDYYFQSTVKKYEVTYYNPGDTVTRDVPWRDNTGREGTIPANGVHIQPYYPLSDSFPSVPGDDYTLSGTMISTEVFAGPTARIKSVKRAFGYADNQFRGVPPHTVPDNPYTPEVENSGGDGFDIHWAVNDQGEYVDLDRIDFVRVRNASNVQGGWLGELSTEITGAVDVPPDPSISGLQQLLVIKDLPPELISSEFQLEPFVFYKGRLQNEKDIIWTTSMDEAEVDENHMLTVTRSGKLTLTASLVENPGIKAIVTTTVNLENSSAKGLQEVRPHFRVYPNPAVNIFYINASHGANLPPLHIKVSLYDATGRLIWETLSYSEDTPVDISRFKAGIYMVRVEHDPAPLWLKLLKE